MGTTEAGTLRIDIRIDGQHPGERPVKFTPTAPAHHRRELRGAVWLKSILRTAGPAHAVCSGHGHQGEHVMFSPSGYVSKEGFFGIDGLRIFLPTEAFGKLVWELSIRLTGGGPDRVVLPVRGHLIFRHQ